MANPSPRIAIVTGASSGIGHACALDLCRRGFVVVAGCRGDDGRRALEVSGVPGLHPVHLDVTDTASIDAAVAHAEALGDGALAGLVNNAGLSLLGPVETMPVATLTGMLDVNVLGAVRMSQRCLPALRLGRGRIVTMGSIAGRSALPFIGGYSASKYALEALTDALRVEVAPWGVEVAIVEPGAIDTPILDKATRSIDTRAKSTAGPLAALYEDALTAFRRAVVSTSAKALPPSHVTRAIAHALTARRPKTRYVVGSEAWGRIVLKALLRDRWHDLAVRLVVGLPGRGAHVAPPSDATRGTAVSR